MRDPSMRLITIGIWFTGLWCLAGLAFLVLLFTGVIR